MECRLRPADDDDWYVFTGLPPPKTWFGYVGESDHMLLGLGCIYGGMDGRWWIMVRRAPGVRNTKTAHTAALRLIELAAEAGITLHAIADERIAGARTWMERLGFEATTEEREGHVVWALN